MTQTLYLNSDGSKWIVVDSDYSRAPMDFMLIQPDGIAKKRRADYYESFGNFATVSFRLKGIRYGGFFSSFERIDGMPVLRQYSKQYNKRQQSLIVAMDVLLGENKFADVPQSLYEEYQVLMDNRIIDISE